MEGTFQCVLHARNEAMLFWRGGNCKGNPLMPRLSDLDSASAPDASSTFRCIFHLPTHLPPPDWPSAPPPTIVPPSACLLTASPGCWDLRHYPATFRHSMHSPATLLHPLAAPWHLPVAVRGTLSSLHLAFRPPAQLPLSRHHAPCYMRLLRYTAAASIPTFFPHSATLVHHVTCALHIFSDLGLISIISAVLYISLHQQVDPYPFLFGSPARCASCLVYFLYDKLNSLDPLLVPRSARPQ